MTTKELIEVLQAADPSGELHVTIGCENHFPLGALVEPAYYDGALQISTSKGGKRSVAVTTTGNKVRIYTANIEEWLWDEMDPSAIDLSALTDEQQAYWKDIIRMIRRRVADAEAEPKGHY